MCDKERLIDAKIKRRNDTHASLAEQMMIEAGGSLSDLNKENSEEESKAGGDKELPICWACNGTGCVEGLFSKTECFNCEGTGLELSNPVKVIKQQREWLAWSKREIIRLRRLNAKLDTRTKEQKEADAVGEFYSGAKLNKHD
ncbi:hypothetical protein [Vibrio sonorensis]|uniref:hypothetical protein n=1 Tax=Vibrio sonorensis TaxID=1004316 RepID=UPI0008DACC40|nr:hypothetical protein [Vibrio sonorensis]